MIEQMSIKRNYKKNTSSVENKTSYTFDKIIVVIFNYVVVCACPERLFFPPVADDEGKDVCEECLGRVNNHHGPKSHKSQIQ
jgi:hypothetical protein